MNTKEATVAMVLSGVLRRADLLPEHALLSGARATVFGPGERDGGEDLLRGPRISLLDWIAKRCGILREDN